MNEVITKLLSDFEFNGPASAADVANAERELAGEFPASYRDFLSTANGGEGPIGEELYLILWPAEELVRHNAGYKVDNDYASDLVFIGTDGGNEVFGFRRGDGQFVAAPLIGMAPEEVQLRGRDFREFLASFA